MAGFPEQRVTIDWDTAVDLFPRRAQKALKQFRWKQRKPELSSHDLTWEVAWRERPVLRSLQAPVHERAEQRTQAVEWVAIVCGDGTTEEMILVRFDWPPDPVCDAILDQEASLG